MQPSDDRAGQDEEGPPDYDLEIQCDLWLFRQTALRRQKRLGPQVHVHQHRQEGENGAEHGLRSAQVVTSQDDRQKVEVQEGDLLRDEVVDQDGRDEREQDKRLLEILEQVGFEPFQRDTAERSRSDVVWSAKRGGRWRKRSCNLWLRRAGSRRRWRIGWSHTSST